MRLAVVIVSYNVCDLLRNCLRSIDRATGQSVGGLDVEVVVVDNASQDGSAEMVATAFPQVDLIAVQKNLGFATGNNLALKTLGFPSAKSRANGAPPDFVLLLNPDTEVVGDALAQMVAFLRKTPDAAACGARLCYGDGSFQHGAFRFPTLAQVALDLLPLAEIPGLGRLLPRLLDSRLNGRYPQRLWADKKPFPVDFVLGATLMVRGEAIRQVGLLDEGFFMYCEEMDWCLRMWEAGWAVYAVPTAQIVHHEGQSSQQVRWASFERLWRSRFRFYGKHARHYAPGYLWVLRRLVRLGVRVRTWQAQRRFACGELAGDTLAEALAAYQRIAKL